MKRIGVFFGGRSGEHDISIKSAFSVIENINREEYQVLQIGIKKDGSWWHFQDSIENLNDDNWNDLGQPFHMEKIKECIDFALPILHGPYGEDGRLQGLFESLDIPYGGCGVLASSVAMDKVMTKIVLRDGGLPCGRFLLVKDVDLKLNSSQVIREIEDKLSYPIFVKPANMGSSLGISKVKSESELAAALEEAACYDKRIIVEQSVVGREVEVGVVGNSTPKASTVGEIRVITDFYNFKSKYSDDEGTELLIPAPLSEALTEKIRKTAIEAYKILDCEGYARVDMFVEEETEIVYINEINTIPGFTRYSMFPTMWREAGVDFSHLIERIIELGYERYYIKNNWKTE